MGKRKICVVTGTRAEYGLLYWLMREIRDDPELVLQVVVTGMHLSPEFGLTVAEIEEDGLSVDARVEMLVSSDTPVGVAKSIGLGVIGFADALDRLHPDIMVVLGDRFEILAAAQAALAARIPVAHISGGESTEGQIDEAIRHAITKMAHLHFVGAEPYRKRVIQLGEQPERVFNFGDPALDNITRMRLMTRQELEQQLAFDLGDCFFLVTYHPVTLDAISPEKRVMELLAALEDFPSARILMTRPNADPGARSIIRQIDSYARGQPGRVLVSSSLGRQGYLSAMKHCRLVIGNSSSGIVEAPALRKATVNIGPRQNGRLKAASIIDCGEDRDAISSAIRNALSPEHQHVTANVASLYGKGDTAVQIKECLKKASLDSILVKRFYDIEGRENT